jgi:hypothetical protein
MDIPLDSVRYFNHGDGVEAILAMEAFPEIAQRVGVMMACFSTAELTLRDLLARVLSISQEEAGDVLGHFNSVSIRIQVVESLSSTYPETDLKEKVRGLLGEIQWLALERNRYAHGLYLVPADNTDRRLIRAAFFTDKRKTIYDEMTTGRVDSDISRAKALLASLWDALRA